MVYVFCTRSAAGAIKSYSPELMVSFHARDFRLHNISLAFYS